MKMNSNQKALINQNKIFGNENKRKNFDVNLKLIKYKKN